MYYKKRKKYMYQNPPNCLSIVSWLKQGGKGVMSHESYMIDKIRSWQVVCRCDSGNWHDHKMLLVWTWRCFVWGILFPIYKLVNLKLMTGFNEGNCFSHSQTVKPHSYRQSQPWLSTPSPHVMEIERLWA